MKATVRKNSVVSNFKKSHELLVVSFFPHLKTRFVSNYLSGTVSVENMEPFQLRFEGREYGCPMLMDLKSGK